MFNILANAFQAGGVLPGTAALEVHPGQLSRWLDEVWQAAPGQIVVAPLPAALPFLGAPNVVASYDSPVAPNVFKAPSGINVANAAQFTGLPGPLVGVPLLWHHLIYSYLLENTGVIEVFAEVMRRATYGETLDIQGNQALQWLRSTEELFFREPPLYSITGVTSQLRAEARVVRRNAYWRLFGMDLSHPLAGGPGATSQGWKQHTGNGVNTSFRDKWSELLRQIWLGIENRNNAVGANATDDAYLLLLCESMRDMLTMRRRSGFLAREEFASVALLSWFELTLSADTPIVIALSAQATTPADRLALIAQRVGMAPAPRSRELFELAQPMSLFLRVLEANAFNNAANVALFYNQATQVYATVNRIIDLWQSATGERVKDRPVGNLAPAGAAQPLRIPEAQPVTAPRLVARGSTGGRP